MKSSLLTFFCFAIPAYLLSGLFGLDPYLNMLGPFQFIIKITLLIGFVFVLIEFWKTEEFTSDDKLFWTIAILFLVPVGLPLLYFKKLNKNEKINGEPNQPQENQTG